MTAWPSYPAGHIVTADEFQAILPMRVERSTDSPGLTTTTLANDDTLFLPVLSVGEWWVRGRLLYSAGDTTADLKIGFTAPAGATFDWGTPEGLQSGATDLLGTGYSGYLTLASQAIFGTINGFAWCTFEGLLKTTGTAGTFQMQEARAGASGTTVVNRLSWMEATRKG